MIPPPFYGELYLAQWGEGQRGCQRPIESRAAHLSDKAPWRWCRTSAEGGAVMHHAPDVASSGFTNGNWGARQQGSVWQFGRGNDPYKPHNPPLHKMH